MKKGFTIVELLMVISILAVLLGIVTTAATASIRESRERRAQAMKQALQNGISTYKVWKDKWPGKLEDWAEQTHDGTVGYLSNGDYDNVMQVILKASAGRNLKRRVMDPVGLQVMSATMDDGKYTCSDFRSAAQKNGKYSKNMSTSEMTVVYEKKETGKAYRYVIEYNTESDDVTVMTQREYNDKNGVNWTGSQEWY